MQLPEGQIKNIRAAMGALLSEVRKQTDSKGNYINPATKLSYEDKQPVSTSRFEQLWVIDGANTINLVRNADDSIHVTARYCLDEVEIFYPCPDERDREVRVVTENPHSGESAARWLQEEIERQIALNPDIYGDAKTRLRELFALMENGTELTMADATALLYVRAEDVGRQTIRNSSADRQGFRSKYRQHTYLDLFDNGEIHISINDPDDVHELQLRPGSAPSYTHDPRLESAGFPLGILNDFLEDALKAAKAA